MVQQPPDPPGTASRALRHDHDFVKYAAARIVSVVGSGITYVALPVLVYRMTGSPLLTGAVTAFEAAPYLLLGLLVGALADRWNRRAMMITADLTSAVIIGSVPVAAAFGAVTSAQALLVAGAAASVFVFFDAANFGAMPSLVERDQIGRANSVVWTGQNLSDIIVPALTGVLLAVASPASLLTVDAVSFLVGALLVSRIRRTLSVPREPAEARSLRSEIGAGLRFLWQERTVRAVTVAGTAQAFAGGAFVGQIVVYADRTFDVQSGLRFGALYGVWGIGSTVAAVAFGRLSTRLSVFRLALTMLPVSAVLSLSVALAPTYGLAVVAIGLWGGVYMLIVMCAVTHRQTVTPEPLLSRVSTTGRMLSWGVGSTGGAFVGGVLASAFGVRAALVAAAGVLVVGSLVLWPSRRLAVPVLPVPADPL